MFMGGILIGRKKRDTGGSGYTKETAYNGNVGYPPGNQGFASDNVQSGYTGNAPQRTNIIHDDAPAARGTRGVRGLFPKHREASAV